MRLLCACFPDGAHLDAGEDLFCRHDECDSFEGWTYACGQCRPCSECRCNNVAIGYVCPLDQCPLGPIDDFKLLETSLHSLQRIPVNPQPCILTPIFEVGHEIPGQSPWGEDVAS